MRVEEVSKLSPLDRFCYWISERHSIYEKRQRGEPKPWTDDEILRSFFFTNPYRENDKTTVWFRENVRDPLRDDPQVLMATVIFRWFNLPVTGAILTGGGIFPEGSNLLLNWNSRKCLLRLKSQRELGNSIFTGAFMIPAEPGKGKIEHVCDCLDRIWKDRDRLLDAIGGGTLQNAHQEIVSYPWLGGFMAYEIVCDLRYTYLLENAVDKLTWCNPGPGCARGLRRLRGESLNGVPAAHGCAPPKDWLPQMRKLLGSTTSKLSNLPTFEMREIEHSLCEFDKYERARLGTGKMKRKYNGR